MTCSQPEVDCFDLAFQAAYPLGESAEMALEDYARALTRARGAEALRSPEDPLMVGGVHVCGMGSTLSRSTLADLEDFARDMATRGGVSTGLSWS